MCLQWTTAMPRRCLFVTCTFWLRTCWTLLLRYQNSHYPTVTMKQRSLHQSKRAPRIVLIWSGLLALVLSLCRNVEWFINVISLLVNGTSCNYCNFILIIIKKYKLKNTIIMMIRLQVINEQRFLSLRYIFSKSYDAAYTSQHNVCIKNDLIQVSEGN